MRSHAPHSCSHKHRLQVQVEDLGLEESGNCVNDYLGVQLFLLAFSTFEAMMWAEVYLGRLTNRQRANLPTAPPGMKRLCQPGTTLLGPTNDSFVSILFHSNDAVTAKGFKVRIHSVPQLSSDQRVECGFPLEIHIQSVPHECSDDRLVLNSEDDVGFISPPGHLGNPDFTAYSHCNSGSNGGVAVAYSVDCQWLIMAPIGHRVQLTSLQGEQAFAIFDPQDESDDDDDLLLSCPRS